MNICKSDKSFVLKGRSAQERDFGKNRLQKRSHRKYRKRKRPLKLWTRQTDPGLLISELGMDSISIYLV